jgi:rhodanese-related sulfurtransferase
MPMSKEGVKDKMKDMNTVVLNVLPENEFARIHIKGSENLPYGQSNDDFASAVEKRFGKDKFFITYCSNPISESSPKAAKALQEKGLKAADYSGGMEEWEQAGFPTEGTEAKATQTP